MKTRFNTYDIICCVAELQKLVGMRVNNVYDIDNKTYLIRLQRLEEKVVILMESGNRIHTTAFEWPKNIAPSGFSMKLRKHLSNKRLEKVAQLGTDRILDLQFGSGEVAFHVILELYDRGNIVLTDYEMTILNILRPHTEGDKVRFAVREKYPQDRARETDFLNTDKLKELISKTKPNDQLKKILVLNTEFGPPLIEHVLMNAGLSGSLKIGQCRDEQIDKILVALKEAESMFNIAKTKPSRGYIIQKKEKRPNEEEGSEKEYFYSNQEFHPTLFAQHISLPYKEFDSFNAAVDEFYSSLESQKIELKVLHQEREAMKKLENVRKDHDKRLVNLEKTQELDKQKAELISRNQVLVDQAILAVQSALASQLSWTNIDQLVKESKINGDPIAKTISQLKLETNHISLFLSDPYNTALSENEKNADNESCDDYIPSMNVDINLGLTAFANARSYYDQKRNAAKKQQKTIDSQAKAFKSAEKKTMQSLKEMQTITNINKARKVYWFEKFFWFVSSENYLIIAGRDQQQNELIVKRYMKPTDIYVHADIHGASSVVIKNPSGQLVPPKTLNEAGTMAICYSIAWDAKVVSNAYWVWGEQVSKTAPTGEYLSTGSFMIRGKKNFLPPSHLILGLSFLFRVEDGFIEKHKGERKVNPIEDADELSITDSSNDVEVEILNESDEGDQQDSAKNLEGSLETNYEKKDGKIADHENPQETDDTSDSESDGNSKFPDTQIKIHHFEETRIDIVKQSGLKLEDSEDEDEKVVYLGDNKPVLIKANQRSRGNSESKPKPIKSDSKNSQIEDVPKQQQQQQAKRGQRSKLKKIKEKYGDQDEEERRLRMEILQSSGSNKESKKSKKNKENLSKILKKQTKVQKPLPNRSQPVGESRDDEEHVVQAEVDMIDALTGIPNAEDELLFAVPVIAPYNTLANYKFKVKLTPGTGKRGKAAKTAVAMFLKDRMITQREKDLLKAVKDEHIARNIPGKVKLSAPRLQTLKKLY